MVLYHSDRLDIAYEMMRESSERPILVCENYHNAIMFMEKITGRLIVDYYSEG